MLRLLIVIPIFFLLSAEKCNQKKGDAPVYKGRLEIKAMCYNYTIKLLEGNIDTTKIVANWTNESTKKSYTNVFALKNPCNFPASIKEGDEFYFTIDDAPTAPCIVCMVYYPTPGRKLPIRIVNK